MLQLYFLQAYQNVVKLAPQHFEARRALSNILNKLGRPEEALHTLTQGIETRLNAYGPLYVEKQLKYWLNLAESFIKARNATTGAPMF